MSRLTEIRDRLPIHRKAPEGSLQSTAAYALALISGALLGGIALALLNRKTIQTLQHELENAPPPPSSDDIY
jgi:hypothetical protein